MNSTPRKFQKSRANIPAVRPAAMTLLNVTLLALALGSAAPVLASGPAPSIQAGQGEVQPMSGAIGDFGLE